MSWPLYVLDSVNFDIFTLDRTNVERYNLPGMKNMKSMKGVIFLASGKHILGKSRQQVFGTAKVGDRGQIVIPKEAREAYGIHPGDTLLLLGDEETGLIVTKPELLSNLANQILSTVKRED